MNRTVVVDRSHQGAVRRVPILHRGYHLGVTDWTAGDDIVGDVMERGQLWSYQFDLGFNDVQSRHQVGSA